MSTRQKSSPSRTTARGRTVAPQRSRLLVLLVLLIGAAVIALVAVLLLVLYDSSGGPVAETSPGTPVPTMTSRDHVPEGTNVEYSTDPPTSGPHWPSTARWGVYPNTRTPPADERLVHNLEHGGVIIYYDPSQLDDATIEQLETLTQELASDRQCVMLTPRESLPDDKPIALTAWGVLALLDDYDAAAIRAFWRDHVAKGPELGEGQCA
jgi:hypothetical protein